MYKDYNWQVVLSLKEDGADLQCNPRFKKMVEATNQPLYILNHFQLSEPINHIYVRNDNAIIPGPILTSLHKICSEQKCNVHVDLNHITIAEKTKILQSFEDACGKASVKFDKGSEHKQESLNRKSLLIYHVDQSDEKKADLLSYFDKWFVKSKGITVRNF